MAAVSGLSYDGRRRFSGGKPWLARVCIFFMVIQYYGGCHKLGAGFQNSVFNLIVFCLIAIYIIKNC